MAFTSPLLHCGTALRENQAIRLMTAYGETVSTKLLLVVALFGIAFFQVVRVVSKRSALAVKLKARHPSGRFNRPASLVMGVSTTVVYLVSLLLPPFLHKRCPQTSSQEGEPTEYTNLGH